MKPTQAQITRWFVGPTHSHGSAEDTLRFWEFRTWEERARGLLEPEGCAVFLGSLGVIRARHKPALDAAWDAWAEERKGDNWLLKMPLPRWKEICKTRGALERAEGKEIAAAFIAADTATT